MDTKCHMSYTAAFKMQAIARTNCIRIMLQDVSPALMNDIFHIRGLRNQWLQICQKQNVHNERQMSLAWFGRWTGKMNNTTGEKDYLCLKFWSDQAKQIALSKGITNFNGNNNCCHRFMKQELLSVWSRTTVGHNFLLIGKKKYLHFWNISKNQSMKESVITAKLSTWMKPACVLIVCPIGQWRREVCIYNYHRQ